MKKKMRLWPRILRSVGVITLALIMMLTMVIGLSSCKKETPKAETPSIDASVYVYEGIDEDGNLTGVLARMKTDENGEVITNDAGDPLMTVVGGTGAGKYVIEKNMSFQPVGPYVPRQIDQAKSQVSLINLLLNYFVIKAYANEEVIYFREYNLLIFELCNAERAKEGLPPMIWDEGLYQACLIRAKEAMLESYSHVRPNGQSHFTVLTELGFKLPKSVGENLAYGQTPEEAVAAWMASPGHRATIMSKNSVTFACAAIGDSYGPYVYVQLFSTNTEPYISGTPSGDELVEETPAEEEPIDIDEDEEIEDGIIDGEVDEVISEDSDLGFKPGDEVDLSDLPDGTLVDLPDDVIVIGPPAPPEPPKPGGNQNDDDQGNGGKTSVAGYYKNVNHPAEYQTINHPAEYQTINHPAEYQTINHPEVGQYVDKSYCTLCGAELGSNIGGHFISSHPDIDGSAVSGYVNHTTVWVVSQPAWTEQKLIKEAWTEKVWVDYKHDHYKGKYCDYCKVNG